MPKLFSSVCNLCDFKTSINSGGRMYVRDESGDKVVCPHPVEHHTIAKVLGVNTDEVLAWLQHDFDKLTEETKNKLDASVGTQFQYVCFDCLAENFIDKKTEALQCSECGSENLKYVAELVGAPCPKCHNGVVKMVDRGIS